MSIIIVALATSQSYVVKIMHLSYPSENQFEYKETRLNSTGMLP